MSSFPSHGSGTADANYNSMNSNPMNLVLPARVRRLLMREFDLRGQLTWDMKMALRHAFGLQ